MNADWAKLSLPSGIVEPERVSISPLDGANGVALSGKLPRWVFAALARKLAPMRPWVAIDDPYWNRIVVVHSRTPSIRVGDVFARPILLDGSTAVTTIVL